MSSLRSANAISGSIIQNSARCRAVWLFSARKVGPKVYTSPRAQACVSAESCHDRSPSAKWRKRENGFRRFNDGRFDGGRLGGGKEGDMNGWTDGSNKKKKRVVKARNYSAALRVVVKHVPQITGWSYTVVKYN